MKQLIPLEIIFGNPVKTSPKISPDGKRISYLAPHNGVLNIWIKTFDKEDDNVITDDKKRGIKQYFWDYDNKHIFYLQDKGGDENWNLYRVNTNDGETKNLTPFDGVQVRVIEYDKHFPDEILLAINKDNLSCHDIYRLNLNTGIPELDTKNPGNICSWGIDSNLKIRGAISTGHDGSVNLIVRDDDKSEWKILMKWGIEDSIRDTSDNFTFSKDGKYIYIINSKNADTYRLIRIETATGEVEVMAEDHEYDIIDLMTDPDTYDVLAVYVFKYRKEWIILNDKIKEDFEAIKKLDDGDFFIVNRDMHNRKWLVKFIHDNRSDSYYIFQRENKEGIFLFSEKPGLDKYELSHSESVLFTARDGLEIHGYITYPPGKERKNLPLVLLVHGGPWWRDVWGYDPSRVQWIASRGYACLQVNFRGSTGYGKKFTNAGDKEWGGKMQDDLTDGVEWALREGIADRKRLAVLGFSYGGYAALAGAAFTPDLFSCAIDVYGVSNLITSIRNIPPYWSVNIKSAFLKRVGNPDEEEEFLKSRSPLFHAHEIKIPLLIAQGANDARVKKEESEQIVEALKKNGIEYEYLLFPDEGHGFVKAENRLKFYETAENFLAKHMGGCYE